MTTLTQSELDDLRRKAEDRGWMVSYDKVLALLDHIAQLTAERDDDKAEIAARFDELQKLRAAFALANDLNSEVQEQIEAKTQELEAAEARIAELESQLSAQFIAGLRRAAEIIKGGQETCSSVAREPTIYSLSSRRHNNLAGLAYAEAILAKADKMEKGQAK